MKANSKPALSSFSSASEMSNNPISVSLDVNTMSYMSAHLIRGVLTSFSMVPQASPLGALGDPAVFSLVGYTISSYTIKIWYCIWLHYITSITSVASLEFSSWTQEFQFKLSDIEAKTLENNGENDGK